MEIKAYVHARWCAYSKEYQYHVFQHESMASVGYIRVSDVTVINFEPNEADMKNATVAAIRDEAQSKVTQLEEPIQSLLAIEHK